VNSENKSAGPDAPNPQRPRRYRLAGVISLVLGGIGAGLVYWLGTRGPDLADEASMTGFNRADARQMGVLYGKQGQLIEDLMHSLKQPGTQALLILAVAGLVAAGCFFFARILEAEAQLAAAPPRTDNALKK
jgi:hypothetical protein